MIKEKTKCLAIIPARGGSKGIPKKYIEKYLYKIDGKATERVVNVIEVMIDEWRKKNEN